MGKLLVAPRCWSRLVSIVLTSFGLLAVASRLAVAQTTNPNVVEFVPPPEHFAVTSSGTPVVSRYDLIFYQVGGLDALMTTTLGKPTPQPDGVIRIDTTTLVTTWPLPNTNLEARVAAIGPNGTAVSDPSNAFIYACGYALSSNGAAIAAAGGSGSVSVSAVSKCSWTATSPVPWITVTTGTTGVGAGSVGFSVAANTGAARTATLSIAGQNYTISQAASTSAPSAIPTVQLVSPTSGASYALGTAITVGATASESGGTISRVDVFANGAIIGSVTASPYTVAWTPSAAGTYALQATAYDAAGVSATSASVSVAVVTSSDPVTTYLSDLAWSSATNGLGPVERDRSNGGSAAGDGHTLALNKRSYAKGIGTAAPLDLRLPLNGACTTFQSDIGIDDEVGRKGSVVFQVWADGVKLFDSGTMTGATATRSIAVDITNRRQLALIVTDPGDGTSNDHADWANARVTCKPTSTQSTPSSTSVYLSDIAWTSATSGWGPIEFDRSNGENVGGDGNTLTLNGKAYSKGLGAHSLSDIRYALNGGCSTFQAEVGVDDEVGARGSVVFQVWADGVQLFDSGVLTGSSETRAVSVSIAGRSALSLVITDGGDGNAYDHGDWANARFSCTNSTTGINLQ